jgi:hypothetical protein
MADEACHEPLSFLRQIAPRPPAVGAHGLTVLTTQGPRACKAITRAADGTIKTTGYGDAKIFTAEAIPVDDDGEWLTSLRDRQQSFIVLGEPVDWPEGEKKPRRARAADDQPATLRDTARAWMPIDMDKFAPVSVPADGAGIAHEVAASLGLQGRKLIWHLTGQHGIEGKTRIRLWVKLATPATAAQMKAWGSAKNDQGCGIDLSVYQPQQPIYTADPVFIGMEPPVTCRVGTLDGEPLTIDTSTPQAPPKSRATDPVIVALNARKLYLKPQGAGVHYIMCPWETAHSGEPRDSDTVYFEPHTNGYSEPGFRCQHSSCLERTSRDFLQALGIAEDSTAVLALNAKHAVVNWKGRTLVLTERTDPVFKRPMFELSSPADFKHWYANRGPLADRWLRHPGRRQYEAVVFAPQVEVPDAYNLWRGFGVEPRQGDCSLFISMVRDVICSGNDRLFQYVMSWCADAVQNPTDRPGVVLVMRGPQGIGKGFFATTVGGLFGAHFLHIRHSRHLVGNFNGHLANTLFLFADEAFWAGDKQGEGALKGLITEPTIAIEFKGKDLIHVQNFVRVVMASNKEWVVPAEFGDRRFFVVDVSDTHARDSTYFGAIHAQLANGGREALLHHLLSMDLSGIDLRRFPETDARHDQQLRSMDPITAWWHERLHAGTQRATHDVWETQIVVGDLFQEFCGELKRPNDRSNQTEFGMKMRKLLPSIGRRRAEMSLSGGAKRQCWVYEFKDLATARREFEGATGLAFDWSEEGSAATRRYERRDGL